MKVLVVGNGGREHALCWKLAQSPRADIVFCAPGNAGTATETGLPIQNVDIPATDTARLVAFAKDNEIGLTVVGPEAPLVAGLVDALEAAGLRAFGPSRAAAELEGSKVFCKELLRHGDIPTGDFHTFRTGEEATTFLNERESQPLVLKADGLAAGKGVIVCGSRDEALDAVQRIAGDKEFGAAGNRLLIEERLHGQEVSILAITDGKSIIALPAAQDHKPAYDGDQGPNTGGMGAYCPAPIVDDALLRRVEEEILVPTVHHMKRKRRPFRGVLYAGLMLTKQGPKVLEYNVRFGDPECQPVLMRLKSDLLDVLEATADGRLDEAPRLEWDPRPAVCVVMASEGYPGSYEKGHVISGLDQAANVPNVKVFHAGTASIDGDVVNVGGRVLGVTAIGDTVPAAKLSAYTAVKAIRWRGAWCRKDIADKAVSVDKVVVKDERTRFG
ncbi:Phosphoribosylamine--glycine ligase [Botrimarina colliarenosi]|uniref:Phosphoribosylamine--glycine ligase n=1 Tax=Botrimarina colliarenosi TaxID=2528001 RepID=A0A5C6AIA9_9BACT|nr:phosphoribosylamine--glycine ligase [Botrimarina colliarenosi]TWT99734.1 Phosphoribosylamine--glycine ligase [Botrimarina colliarenosi]